METSTAKRIRLEEHEEEDPIKVEGVDNRLARLEELSAKYSQGILGTEYEVIVGPDSGAPSTSNPSESTDLDSSIISTSTTVNPNSTTNNGKDDSTIVPSQPPPPLPQAPRSAFRFSGSSVNATLHLEITPEQQEAMMVTGVNASNYSSKIRPPGGYTATQRRKSALEDNLDESDNPRWRDPGAIQSDFFNFGLNEITWKEYAARQVALRLYRLQSSVQD